MDFHLKKRRSLRLLEGLLVQGRLGDVARWKVSEILTGAGHPEGCGEMDGFPTEEEGVSGDEAEEIQHDPVPVLGGTVFEHLMIIGNAMREEAERSNRGAPMSAAVREMGAKEGEEEEGEEEEGKQEEGETDEEDSPERAREKREQLRELREYYYSYSESDDDGPPLNVDEMRFDADQRTLARMGLS
jgi:hypothetical protein